MKRTDKEPKMINLRTALVALSIAVAAPAAAQDFTSMDITGMYNAWAHDQNQLMGQITQDIIYRNVNDPHVQAMYFQAVAQGYFGSIEDFAFAYAQTAGFTPGGIAEAHRANGEITAKMGGQNSQFMPQGTIYGPAYGAYTQGNANIMNQRGIGFSGW
jgi:hypothetical protein